MIGNLNLNLSVAMQESGRMREEIESLKKLTATLETKNKKMGKDLIGYDRDLRTMHELYEKQAALEQQLGETCRQKSEMEGRLGALYTDALDNSGDLAKGEKKKSDDGTGILHKGSHDAMAGATMSGATMPWLQTVLQGTQQQGWKSDGEGKRSGGNDPALQMLSTTVQQERTLHGVTGNPCKT